MALELTGLNPFAPLFVFLLVFVVMYALLAKLKLLGEQKYIHLLISFIIAIIFVAFTSTREIVIKATPWAAVLLVLVFFIMILVGFTQKKMDDVIGPWLGWVVIILLVLIFLIIFMKVLGYNILNFLGDFNNIVQDYPKIFGALAILVVAALASWVITRK